MSTVIDIFTNTTNVFIIPNAISKLKDYYDPKGRKFHLNAMLEKSGLEKATDDTMLVELWFVDQKTFGTDNLIDHGGRVMFEDKEFYFRPDSIYGILPVHVFHGKTDGDTVELKIPVELEPVRLSEDDEQEEKLYGMIHMTATLNQKDFRYRHFGSFGNLLFNLTQNALAKEVGESND